MRTGKMIWWKASLASCWPTSVSNAMPCTACRTLPILSACPSRLDPAKTQHSSCLTVRHLWNVCNWQMCSPNSRLKSLSLHLSPSELNAAVPPPRCWSAGVNGPRWYTICYQLSIGERVSALTVHEATDGSLRVLIGVYLYLTCKELEIDGGFFDGLCEPEFCWSPASMHLLVKPTNGRHARAVIHPDRHVEISHGHRVDLLLVQPPCFSDCGGFVVLVGPTDASDSDEPDGPPDSITGYIWNVQTRQYVFRWEEYNPELSGRHVARAPLPGICFVPGCLALLFLAEAGQQAPVCRRCDGPTLFTWPAPKALVAMWGHACQHEQSS